MSKIDKLTIRGIRAFSNDGQDAIQFFSPLTLIVGNNGSGKTTIIECLKYATTGDLPPNSKGGAFIHDPKLVGEKDVLAQVRLSFDSTSGARMDVVRSIQLTIKKDARSQKTLDCTLTMAKHGEKTTVSSRVAELDQLMPQYLGVSKAVLDNVIFCHQDESLWPMSEPSVLKKKFDEIFEALKYTKAIDNIKVIRKNMNITLGQVKITEKFTKEAKDKGERAQKKMNELDAEIAVLREKTTALSADINEANRKAEAAFDQASKFQVTVASLESKRADVQTKQERIDDLNSRMKEMPESDRELQDILDHYGERVSVHEQEERSQRRRYTELSSQLEQCRQDLSTKHAEHGGHQQAKESYDRQLHAREVLVKETARRHVIRGFDSELDKDQIRDFTDRLAKMLRDKNVAHDKAKRETQQKLQDTQQELNKLNERKSALQQRREGARSVVSSNDRKLDNLQRDLNQVDVDEGGKANLESHIEDLGARLKTASLALDSAGWDKQVQDAVKKLQDIDEEADRLNAEFSEATKRVGDSAKLDFLRSSLKDSKRSLETMTGAHGDNITKILNQEWLPTDLEQKYRHAVEQKTAAIKEAEKQRDGTNRELEQISFKLTTVRGDLKSGKERLSQAEKTVRDECDDEPTEYPSILMETETSRDTLRGDRDNFSNLKTFYGSCVETAKANDICRLCERMFKGTTERTKFIAKMEKSMNEAQLKVIVEELQEVEETLKGLRSVGPSYEIFKRLSEIEIPQLEAELRRLEPQHAGLLEQIQEQDRIVNESQASKREVDSIAKNVQTIAKHSADIANYEGQIKEVMSKVTQSGSSSSLEEIQDQVTEVNDRRRTTSAYRDKVIAERDRAKAQIAELDLELRDAQSRLSKVMYQLKEKTGLVSQIEELSQQNKTEREAIKGVESDLQDLGPQISQSQAKYDDISHRGNETERELQQEKDKISESVNQLRSAEIEIDGYVERGGAQQLARTRREIETLEESLGKIENEQKQVTVAINKAAEQLRTHEATKQGIVDNLTCRKLKRDLETIKTEIIELESKNAERDRDFYNKEGERHQILRSKLSGEQAGLVGQMKSKDDTLRGYIEDWNTDYKNAATEYKEAHIKVEAYKAAVEDLGRYGGALDKAIMKYHSMKMGEINRIIEELWQRTYQGTDVDTILIRSDNENPKGNKSYNYRVCMVKQDVEMDMRGRCSAGQRVLASIIIRLALAECFGQRCGLIALDEPTTNLDRENIQALAESMHAIIKARQGQNNLQLIIITHDEEFLRHMQASEFGDYYYRVYRNEKQKSKIAKQFIADVCD